MQTPVATTQMLIRRPAPAVFAAFADPAITARFWFSSGSAVLEEGETVQWEWEMFGASAQVRVLRLEPDKRIVIEWPGQGTTNTVEWLFADRHGEGTLVSICESGFDPAAGDIVGQVADATGGFSLVLAGAKAWLEHGIALNLVADRFPDGPSCHA